MALLVFKTSVGFNKVPGGFDSHPPPPASFCTLLTHMLGRITQPPMDSALRNWERHNFWPGFAVAFAAAILLVYGARHLTRIETTDGGTAWETQLVKAYSSGGLKFPELAPPPPPPAGDDPAASAAALERWQRQAARTAVPNWKVRVDTSASTPCPT